MTLIDLHGSTFDRAMPKKLQIIRKNGRGNFANDCPFRQIAF